MTWQVKMMHESTKKRKKTKIKCSCGNIVPVRRMIDVKKVKAFKHDFCCDGCLSSAFRKNLVEYYDYMVQQGCPQGVLEKIRNKESKKR